jgi:hypothetical protein
MMEYYSQKEVEVGSGGGGGSSVEALRWNEIEKWAGSLPRLKGREMGGG